MADGYLSRFFVGMFAIVDGTDKTRKATVSADGEVSTVDHVPVGGGITWTKTAVTLTGSSQTVLSANASRKGIEIRNPSGNDLVAWDKAGGTVTLTTGAGILALGGEYLTGDDCPLGAITAIGTTGQVLLVWEGV